MDTETKKQEISKEAVKEVVKAPATSATPFALAAETFRAQGGGAPRRGMKRPPREARPKSEYDQKIISIRRVTRVAAGGKRFNFSVAVVLGNRKGSVGVGTGKAGDTSLAIDNAVRNAKKHLIRVKTTKTMSIPHEVRAKYSSARVLIMPAPGRGIVAGSSVRTVIDLAGLKDITAKLLSPTKNPLNIAQVAVMALSQIADRPMRVVKAEIVADEASKDSDEK